MAVTGGRDTWLWRVAGSDLGPLALKVYRRAEQRAAAEREVAALQRAEGGAFPVPHVVKHTIWRGFPMLLLTWCEGTPMGRAASLRPHRIWPLAVAFGRVQAAIHRLDAPERLTSQGARWIDRCPSRYATLRAQVHSTIASTRLLHLDYHPLNVMVRGGRITGVLDWTNAAAGDPRADAAMTAIILREPPTGPAAQRAATRILGWIADRRWRRGYREVAGRMPELGVFIPWALAVRLRDFESHVARGTAGAVELNRIKRKLQHHGY